MDATPAAVASGQRSRQGRFMVVPRSTVTFAPRQDVIRSGTSRHCFRAQSHRPPLGDRQVPGIDHHHRGLAVAASGARLAVLQDAAHEVLVLGAVGVQEQVHPALHDGGLRAVDGVADHGVGGQTADGDQALLAQDLATRSRTRT